jgi:hypothetical protein
LDVVKQFRRTRRDLRTQQKTREGRETHTKVSLYLISLQQSPEKKKKSEHKKKSIPTTLTRIVKKAKGKKEEEKSKSS